MSNARGASFSCRGKETPNIPIITPFFSPGIKWKHVRITEQQLYRTKSTPPLSYVCIALGRLLERVRPNIRAGPAPIWRGLTGIWGILHVVRAV